MDDEDDKWLKEFNEKRGKDDKLDEDHYELIMWQFEKITNERVPYLQLVRIPFDSTSMPKSSYQDLNSNIFCLIHPL